MQDRTPTRPVVPDFTPVPRKYRYDGWTPERQRAFIDALAEIGSVKAACQRINMTAVGAYYLRRQPGAESFRRAWDAALDHGVQSLADIAIDRAREGVPVPVFHKGEQVGERRWYNDRLLMFILRHHLPQRYGPLAALPPGTQHPETIARETAQAEGAAAWVEDKARALARLAWLHRRKSAALGTALAAGDTATAALLTDQARRLEQAMDGDPNHWHMWGTLLPAAQDGEVGVTPEWADGEA